MKHRRKSPGRPRKSGDRKPCGRLRQVAPEPNSYVLERRRALAGPGVAVEAAENPLDLAHARGWLTERQHRAGAAYARIKRACKLGSQRVTLANLPEAPEWGEKDVRPIGQLPDAMIVQALENIALPAPNSSQERTERAMAQWAQLCEALGMDELTQVEFVCVEESWPFWLTHRIARAAAVERGEGEAHDAKFGKASAHHETKFQALASGLDKIADLLFRTKDGEGGIDTIEPLSFGEMNSQMPAASKRVVEVRDYVDPEGNKLFEVERVSRRRRTVA